MEQEKDPLQNEAFFCTYPSIVVGLKCVHNQLLLHVLISGILTNRKKGSVQLLEQNQSSISY